MTPTWSRCYYQTERQKSNQKHWELSLLIHANTSILRKLNSYCSITHKENEIQLSLEHIGSLAAQQFRSHVSCSTSYPLLTYSLKTVPWSFRAALLSWVTCSFVSLLVPVSKLQCAGFKSLQFTAHNSFPFFLINEPGISIIVLQKCDWMYFHAHSEKR